MDVLGANFATNCLTFAFLKVTLSSWFKTEKVGIYSCKSYWVVDQPFRDSRACFVWLRLVSFRFVRCRLGGWYGRRKRQHYKLSTLSKGTSVPDLVEHRGGCAGAWRGNRFGPKPPKRLPTHNCSNRGCFIQFWMFLRANFATNCSTFAFLKVTLRSGFELTPSCFVLCRLGKRQ